MLSMQIPVCTVDEAYFKKTKLKLCIRTPNTMAKKVTGTLGTIQVS